ncbi:MAG: D-cysteine desulfhydrase [Myxococcota bacterium]|jgi:D-cysteine desulfhydrase
MIEPLRLAQIPSPIQPLPRLSKRLGVELWIKRDDLTGAGLSGNKVRKLCYLLAEAKAQGASAVITCGGIQSNHCRATAIAARQVGLVPVLLLRGEPPADIDGNLLLDVIVGATIHWTDAAGYQRRDEQMAVLAEELRAAGERPYIIPEGGSNAVGALGFVAAGAELARQLQDVGLQMDTVVSATGSGGTLAGLALSGAPTRMLGVAVCDDRDYFRAKVEAIGREALDRFGLRLPAGGWDVLDGAQGRGYALATPEELRAQASLAREEGILLDPVYTGKAWCALLAAVTADPRALGERVMLWHTGGLFGVFGRGAEYAAALTEGT